TQVDSLLSCTLMHGLHCGGRYNTAVRAPMGAYITGVSGPNRPTVGVPSAAARCIGPESFETTPAAPSSSAQSSPIDSAPASSTLAPAGSGCADAAARRT